MSCPGGVGKTEHGVVDEKVRPDAVEYRHEIRSRHLVSFDQVGGLIAAPRCEESNQQRGSCSQRAIRQDREW